MTNVNHIAMQNAWLLARDGARRFGGRPAEYFRLALVMAYRDIRRSATDAALRRLTMPATANPVRRAMSALWSHIAPVARRVEPLLYVATIVASAGIVLLPFAFGG